MKTLRGGLNDLRDLRDLRDALARHRREQAEREARERAERLAAEQAHRLFVAAVGDVTPLRASERAEIHRPKPEPLPRQREADERAALRESLSDEVDIETLLLTDDGLSYRRPGIGANVVARLRRGHWSIQNEIDLHGLRRDEAREALVAFVNEAARRGQRCVRVVHGKGHGSPGKRSVLKAKAQRWLAQCGEVIAFAQASGPQGGAGALIVLLDRRARASTPEPALAPAGSADPEPPPPAVVDGEAPGRRNGRRKRRDGGSGNERDTGPFAVLSRLR